MCMFHFSSGDIYATWKFSYDYRKNNSGSYSIDSKPDLILFKMTDHEMIGLGIIEVMWLLKIKKHLKMILNYLPK